MFLNLIKFFETTSPTPTPTVDPSASGEVVEAAAESAVSWDSVLEKIVDWATTTGIKLIIALLLLIISFTCFFIYLFFNLCYKFFFYFIFFIFSKIILNK